MRNENDGNSNTLASKIINSVMKPTFFPSPMVAENQENIAMYRTFQNQESFHFDQSNDFDAALTSRNKNYINYVMNQQKKRQFGSDHPKRSMKFFNNQDIQNGSGLNNSLLIRRLKF